MGTRKEYEDAVKGPGKFEGEPAWAAYFWDQYLEGGQDDDDGTWLRFDLMPSDYGLWPELKGHKVVWLMEDDQGFVHTDLD